jgi:ABC-type spermidine/putrescine transport system permease subunit II
MRWVLIATATMAAALLCAILAAFVAWQVAQPLRAIFHLP